MASVSEKTCSPQRGRHVTYLEQHGLRSVSVQMQYAALFAMLDDQYRRYYLDVIH